MRKPVRKPTDATGSAGPTLLRSGSAIPEAVRSSPPCTVLITGTGPDRLSNNTAIRTYAADGLRTVWPDTTVSAIPVEVAANVARRIRPDLILAIGSLAVDGNELRALRHAADCTGATLALWLHDDPYEMDYAFRAEAVADVIFTNDAWARLHYRHPSVHHLPLAGCRRTYLRPVTDASRATELFFCGHAHPNRVAFFRTAQSLLSNYSVAVAGTGWPADLSSAVNGRLAGAQIADAAQRAQLTLNLPRTGSIANRRFDLPASTPGPRTFEIALAGSAQVCWSAGPEIEDYFKPDEEIILVDGLHDLARTLERAREEPSHFTAIAAAAQRRALREHCYEHRMAQLMQITFGGASAARGPATLLPAPTYNIPELARAVG